MYHRPQAWKGTDRLVCFVGLVVTVVTLYSANLISQERISSQESNVKVSKYNKPVILLGLPRSGSQAIHDYFECHGWKSAHYCCDGSSSSRTTFPCKRKTCGECVLKNMKNERPPFQECAGHGEPVQVWSQFDVETAEAWFLPQHFSLGLLHKAYPNATWIYNTRSSSRDWAESIFHWHSMTRRFFQSYNLPLDPPASLSQAPDPSTKVTPEEIEQDMARQLESRVYNQTEHLRKLVLLQRIHKNHTATIHQWARSFPSHPFLSINVDDSSSAQRVLNKVFEFKESGKSCKWTFQSPNEDWRDFSLPFDTTDG